IFFNSPVPGDGGGSGDGRYNPVMKVIYAHRGFDDKGDSLGRAFSGAVDYETSHAQSGNAAVLTRTVIDNVLDHGRGDMGRVRDFLGNTLADHYMSDLYESADNYDLGSADHERVHGAHFSLSHHRTVELLENMLGRESAATNLMNGVAAHQTNLVHEGVRGH